MKRNLSIGIFHANSPLQIHTLNLAKALSAAGLDVSVFLYNAKEDLVDTHRHECLPLTFHRIDSSNLVGNPLRSIRTKPRNPKLPQTSLPSQTSRHHSHFNTYARGIPGSLLIRLYIAITQKRREVAWRAWLKSELVDSVIELLSGRRLDYVFGIEPYGFLWADAVAQRLAARSIYYSLEIENNRWPEVSTYLVPSFRRLRNNAIDRCDAVIIQDTDRLDTFRKHTAWQGQRVFYIPVSLFGGVVDRPTRFLHQELDIPTDKKIILSFGWITRSRGICQLIDAAKSFNENWVLVLHSGLSWNNDVPLIQKANEETNGKIRLSLKRLAEDKLQSMVNSASVGLCFYSDCDENNRLTAHSSEKMARYAKGGLPVVAWNYLSYQKLFHKFPFGVCVDSYNEVPNALRQIFERYDQHRSSSFAAFQSIYSAEGHYKSLIEWIVERES